MRPAASPGRPGSACWPTTEARRRPTPSTGTAGSGRPECCSAPGSCSWWCTSGGDASNRRPRNCRARAEVGRVTLLLALSRAIESRDPYASGHGARVMAIAQTIAARLVWDDDQIEVLRLGAALHDIG